MVARSYNFHSSNEERHFVPGSLHKTVQWRSQQRRLSVYGQIPVNQINKGVYRVPARLQCAILLFIVLVVRQETLFSFRQALNLTLHE